MHLFEKQSKKKIAVILILFPLLILLLAQACGVGSVMWTSFVRACSPKNKSIATFVELFNSELEPRGYHIDLHESNWEQISAGTQVLTVPMQNPSAHSLICKMTVTEYDQPSFSLPVISLTIVESVSPSNIEEASALPLPAQTVFALFTPNYVQNPEERYGFGYAYSTLWQRFTDSLTATELHEQIPFFSVPQRDDISLTADVFLIDIQSSREECTRSVSWFWY